MTKKPKLISSIRAKLVSAVAMLLVAVIMVVSSTYAWFTLSTAPEVSGIQTSIGANGALEMALNATGNLADIKNYTPNSQVIDENTTWGNLVDLSTGYGLDKIVLYPSQIKLNDDNTTLSDTLLQGPTYGPDGRLSGFTPAVTGGYNTIDGVFYPNPAYGVQAVGRASGMSTRELMHRDAMTAASSAASAAKKAAADTLATYGNDLGNLAIKHALSSGTDAYTATDLAVVSGIITDMETKVLPALEKAYLYHVLAAATADSATSDDTCTALEAAIKGGATLNTIQTTYAAQYAKLNATIKGYVETVAVESETDLLRSYTEMLNSVTDAKSKLPGTKDSYDWSDISSPLANMVDMSKITVNGMTVDKVRENQGSFINQVLKDGGLFINMETGGGLYADLADHCGDYSTSIALDIQYGADLYEDMPATMRTATKISTVYLTASYNISSALDVVAGDSSKSPITEFYGYVLDLAFRTNATDSKLQLQTTAENRIYEGDTTAATMGAGSTMTFKASDDMTYQQVVNLMNAYRIVFFQRAEGGVNTIIAQAALGDIVYDEDTKKYSGSIYLYDTDGKTLVTEETNTLLALDSNTATALSVLVYLDGNVVTNSDVSATSATSLVGTMNLQFSSSAPLVPMEYDGFEAAEYDVNVQKGDSVKDTSVGISDTTLKASSDEDYVFGLTNTVDGTAYLVGYRVGNGMPQQLTAQNDKYTIPKAQITGDITIVIGTAADNPFGN